MWIEKGYIHWSIFMQRSKTEPERLCNWSSLTIFPSTVTGMNELICFTLLRIKGLKVPEDWVTLTYFGQHADTLALLQKLEERSGRWSLQGPLEQEFYQILNLSFHQDCTHLENCAEVIMLAVRRAEWILGSTSPTSITKYSILLVTNYSHKPSSHIYPSKNSVVQNNMVVSHFNIKWTHTSQRGQGLLSFCIQLQDKDLWIRSVPLIPTQFWNLWSK